MSRYQLERLRKMQEGKDTIKDLLILIENSGESFRMSNDYLYNVLSRIKDVTIPAAYSAGKEGCEERIERSHGDLPLGYYETGDPSLVTGPLGVMRRSQVPWGKR